MPHPTRRDLMAGAALSGLALTATRVAAHDGPVDSEGFTYEVQRTDAEWREMLSEAEYHILREGGTEARFTSDYAAGHTDGHFHCRGCDLPVYRGSDKIILPIGWVFFYHAVPNAVLMDIDPGAAMTYGASEGDGGGFVEAHCRRCGSHFGHMIVLEQSVLHCINGTALVHSPATA